MLVRLDREQTLELRSSVDLRIAQLEKIRKTLAVNHLSTNELDAKLYLLRGDDDTSGLRDLIHEQVTMFETGQFGDLEFGLAGPDDVEPEASDSSE